MNNDNQPARLEAIPIDSHIQTLKRRLSGIDFDDPDYAVISRSLDEAYEMIKDGQSHFVPF